jgi:RimJ/RimL family protein N-acetyltransferase
LLQFYGGLWADSDAVTGARLSKGGKSIVALPSKSLHGRSNVLFALPRGTGVSITRSDVEYVVTEYGTVYLYGKSIRERCLALVAIAHPDFRPELLALAKANHYISSAQPGLSFNSRYPQQFECVHTTKSGRSVFCRPIKAVDEDQLRSFFHKLSNHSVYLRYFRVLKSMPQRILQKTTDSRDMAIVVLYPPDAAQQELIGIGQWVMDNKDGVPEVAFQVRDDWQGEGLGTFLFSQLLAMCEAFGITQLKADVLGDNIGMRRVFEKSSVARTCHVDFGVISYKFHLSKKNNQSS